MECVHAIGEYHGDLHSDNVILQRYGLTFDMKLVDLFQSSMSKRDAIQSDTVDLMRSSAVPNTIRNSLPA